MNSGGGGIYNKATARRKSSSLVLSRPRPNSGAVGIATTAGNASLNDHDGGGVGTRRGGQLQLQSVSRAPLAQASKESSSKPVDHRNGQHRQPWSAGPPLPRASNTLNVATNSGNGYSRGGYAGPNRGGLKQLDRAPNRPAPRNRQNDVEILERGESGNGRGSQNFAHTRRPSLPNQGRGQFGQEVAAPEQQRGQVPKPSAAVDLRTGVERSYNGAPQQNQRTLTQQSQRDQQQPAYTSSHSQQHPPSTGASSSADASVAATANTPARAFSGGVAPLSNGAPRTGVKATSLPPVPLGLKHTHQSGIHPQPGAAQASGAGGQTVSLDQDAEIILDEEAALRARLAELEARNTQMSARVTELEEHNFDLEASMQLIEVEASHRVQKEARALQSELSFKDHQLKQAQSNHTTAVKELNAERSRRKVDREQARREREEAAAAASAALAEAAAAAATAAAAGVEAEKEAEAKAAQVKERLNRKAASTRPRRWVGYDGNDGRALFLPTLADLVLEELSDEVMVLLHAGAADGGGEVVEEGGGVDTGVLWTQTPSSSQRRRGANGRGVFSPSSPFITSDSTFPGRSRARVMSSSSGQIGVNMGDSGGSGREGSGARREGRVREFSGASPLALAFSPGLLAPRQRQARAEGVSGARGGSVSSSCSKFSGGNLAVAQSSPESRRREERGVGEAVRGRLGKELRFLSSRMFSCAIALVQGEACAGDLLDILVGFIETAGEAGDDNPEILVSATRLVHRTLAVTPPAAAAVALGGAQVAAPPGRQVLPSTDGSVAAVAVFGSVDPENDGEGGADRSYPSSPAHRKGKKRARSELASGKDAGVGCSERSLDDFVVFEEEENGGVKVGDDNGGAKRKVDDTGRCGRRRGVRRPRYVTSDGKRVCPPEARHSCRSLFIAGEPVRARDVPSTPARGSGAGTVTEASPLAKVVGGGKKGEKKIPTAREVIEDRRDASWAGRHREYELGRRLKGQLAATFHWGTARGYSPLVQGCLEAILCVLWDRTGEYLTQWSCLLNFGSFKEVMLSEVHRSAWEVGARVLHVLARNAALFQRVLTVGQNLGSGTAVGVIAGAGLPGGEERTSAVTSRIARGSSAPPTPPPIDEGRSSRRGDGGSGGTRKEDLRDMGASESLLRRLCLEAVAVGEHASYGRDVGLRLSVIRLVFSACQRYGSEATRPLFANDGLRGGNVGDDASGSGLSVAIGKSSTEEQPRALGLIPALVTFVRVELEDWERRRYSQPNPVHSERTMLLKEAFQLLWALAMHTPLPLRDMAQGAGMFNTMVSVVSRFYNSVEMEEFQVHKEALMLVEKMN